MATKTIKSPKFVNGAPTAEVEVIQVEDYGNSSWGPKDKHRLLNTRLTRVDAPFKATGTGSIRRLGRRSRRRVSRLVFFRLAGRLEQFLGGN